MTSPHHPHDDSDQRAQELALHGRRGALTEDERRELAALVAARPSVAAEIAATGRWLDGLHAARVEPGPEFRQRLEQRLKVETLARRRRTSRRQAAHETPWTRGWRFLLGKDARTSGQTAVFLRSAALYVGAASVLVPWLILREPAPDRAVAEDRVAAWIPAPPRRDPAPAVEVGSGGNAQPR